MTRIELQATIREKSGKGTSRRLRANAQIPAVLYGRHLGKPINLAVDPKALREAMATPKRLNTILTLKLDNGEERTVLLKDYQTASVKRALLHADFIDVRMDDVVTVNVPLSFDGLPAGVKEGGILQVLRRDLEVKALPAEIPDSIPVDVSEMKIGASLHLRDLPMPKGITPTALVNFTIVSVVAPEAEVAAPAATEAAAAVAGAPAAGATPAAAAPGAAAAPAAAATPAKK
ncbi:MAG TPA: 50S ribosomal protein L25 [Myxococcales bacterium]|nr:50S ribosomal protein L25 [Myxococcales bacterium]